MVCHSDDFTPSKAGVRWKVTGAWRTYAAGLALALTPWLASATEVSTTPSAPGQPAESLRLLSTATPVIRSAPTASSRPGEAYGRLPLSFEPNVGQAGGQFQFLARGSGYGLYLSPTGAVLVLARTALGEQLPPSETPRQEARTTGERRGPSSGRRSLALNHQPPIAERQVTALRVDLVGAAPQAAMTGRGELPGRMNYFKGSDPAQWRANVPTYSSVAVQGVYPGIDLVYYGNQRHLEYDFVVAPGADPARITLAWQGAEEVKVDAYGDLVLRTKAGEVRQHRPIVYQDVGGVRKEISGRYVLRSGPTTATDQPATRVGFEVAAYDRSRPLVIDPVLSYSSFLGGAARERGWDIAADGEGNAYVTGITLSTNFPVANALQANFGGGGDDSDMFVMKLDASGTNLVYSTYLGGTTEDAGFAIAVDADGNAYVTGLTTSTNFPTATAFQPAIAGKPPRGLTVHPFDVVVLKLNPTGSALVYSTYLGGSGEDEGIGIAVDSSGSAYVTGQTTSTNFPTANPLQAAAAGAWEAFVTKLSPDGTALVYSTYLGGLAEDYGEGVAVDGDGNACVTGITSSTNFPTANALQTNYNGGAYDVFATKLSAAGTELVYSTYLGGQDEDQGLRVALDAAGNAYVTGKTFSTNFPTANALQAQLGGFTNEFVASDAFVAKLNAAGSALVYSTYLGGDSTDEGWDIAVDALGNAYVGGLSLSTNFPVTANALLSTNAGSYDAFVTMLNPSGAALAFSTLLGGNLQDDAYGIDVDGAGNIYVTGRTISTNFPTVLPLRPTPPDNFFDLFVTRIAPDPMLNVERTGNTVTISCLHSLAGFALEAAESLAAPVTWTPVTTTPTRNGLYDTIELDASSGGQYFRLRRP